LLAAFLSTERFIFFSGNCLSLSFDACYQRITAP
jgi:hypothetical protein